MPASRLGARTSCGRCRALHRRCDESRPRCRRCSRAGVECEYRANVSFLDKNAQTLSSSAASSIPRATSPPRRSNIEFVLETLAPAHSHHIDGVSGASRTPASAPPEQSSWDASLGWPLVGECTLTDNEVGLLKHYTHHVAPWLDVYDHARTFHQLVPRLAIQSPFVLHELLKLSAASSSSHASSTVPARPGVGLLHLRAMLDPPGQDSPLSAVRVMAVFALGRSASFVQNAPETWRSSFSTDTAFSDFSLSDFAEVHDKQCWSACAVLLMRLEIAFSLMHQTASVNLNGPLRRALGPAPSNMGSSPQQTITDAAHRCLALLADVINFCLPPAGVEQNAEPLRPMPIAIDGRSRIDKWKALLMQLSAWQEDRPAELQAVVDLDGSDSGFPIVVFTSGAGTSCSLLFHAAMLLLLSRRPLSTTTAELQASSVATGATLSPIWHARRVCGIALNSEPLQSRCWDPSMIAAFFLAAQRVTAPSQHAALLHCLAQLQTTGWQLDGLGQRLREEWGSHPGQITV